MKIYIGPYRGYIGPFQIAEKLMFWSKDKDAIHKFGERLAGPDDKPTLLYKICSWIDKKKKRDIRIRIDKYDTWNMDSTLSMIVLPMLKQLQNSKHGAPIVDDDDVPEYLKSTTAPPKKDQWDTDDNFHKRWDWVLNEIIWTFEQLQPDYYWEEQYWTGDCDIQWVKDEETHSFEMVNGPKHTRTFDSEKYKIHSEKINNGLRLFGKYYRALWN